MGKHGPDIFHTSDPWFRGVELMYGPDGSVFVLDWSDIGECHESDGIHRTSGRIFKLSYGTPTKPEHEDLFELPDLKLIELLGDENEWLARTARRVFVDREVRKHKSGVNPKFSHLPSVMKMVLGRKGESVPAKIRALGVAIELSELRKSSSWPDPTAKATIPLLKRLADSEDEAFRAFIVRMLVEIREKSKAKDSLFLKMASDPSPLVRLYVASAIDRLDAQQAFAVATKLVSVEADMDDRVQPNLIWYRIEPLLANDFDRSMELFAACKSQRIRQNIARRLACDPERQNELLESLVQRLLDDQQPHVADMLQGIAQAVEGRKQLPAPDSWAKLVAQAKDFDTEVAQQIEAISPVFGDGLSIDRLKKLAVDSKADAMARKQAILSLSQYADADQLFPLFEKLLSDRMVNDAVAKAVAVCNEPKAATLILKRYRGLSAIGKRNAIDTLCSRQAWASKLLDAIKRNRVPVSMLTAWHARQVRLFDDPKLTEQLTDVWGAVRDTDAERSAQIDSLRKMLTSDEVAKADLASGKALFGRHCASCHAMFGQGGNIGPDLTGADRKNLNYLLENIIDPSASVATTWRTSVLAMEDGRVLAGVVLDKTSQTLKLQTKDEQITLEVDAIEAIKATEHSLMPSGLLDSLSDQEKADLFGYLMSP